MSPCASVLFLNGLSESSFFHTEHFKANDKYRFATKNKVISTRRNDHISVTEPVEVTGKAFFIFNPQGLRYRTLEPAENSVAAFDETLEPTEIPSRQTTRCWSERKFLHGVRQSTGTCGNSLPAFDRMLELAEIPSQHSTMPWNERKFLASVRQSPGTSGNSFTAFDKTLELAEIVAGLAPCLPSFALLAPLAFLLHKNRQNSQSVFITECKNTRKFIGKQPSQGATGKDNVKGVSV